MAAVAGQGLWDGPEPSTLCTIAPIQEPLHVWFSPLYRFPPPSTLPYVRAEAEERNGFPQMWIALSRAALVARAAQG